MKKENLYKKLAAMVSGVEFIRIEPSPTGAYWAVFTKNGVEFSWVTSAKSLKANSQKFITHASGA